MSIIDDGHNGLGVGGRREAHGRCRSRGVCVRVQLNFQATPRLQLCLPESQDGRHLNFIGGPICI